MRLAAGQKTPLSALGLNGRVSVEVDYGVEGVDVVLFGLNSSKKIGDDRYTILFSNPTSPEGAVRMHDGNLTTTFDIDLTALPSDIQRLMIVASHDTLPLQSAKPLAVTVGEASFDAGSVMGSERAAMLAEIYLHNGEWRLAAIGQGFAQGLARLVEHLGGSVADDAPSPTTPVRDVAPNNSVTPPTPPPAAPISLSKITLDKRETISLEKKGRDFGDIVVNLNWSQQTRGFFGGGSKLDLDLGCLYELRNGGKGVVQALGNSFGDYDYDPFIELDGDDRTGSNSAGETIRINGERFDEIKRIAVFALIYEGAANWAQTDARISIRMPGQREVEVQIRDGNNRQNLYGMAVIENDRGTMRITNHAMTYRDQREYAEALGIRLRWVQGSKD